MPWTRNERSAVAGLKTTSYAENVVALARAKARGAHRGDLRQHPRRAVRGHRHQRLRRRRRRRCSRRRWRPGCLAGITRELMLEWGRAEGLRVREETLPLACSQTADEVFITSSTKDVLPISAVDDRTAPAPGPSPPALREVLPAGNASGPTRDARRTRGRPEPARHYHEPDEHARPATREDDDWAWRRGSAPTRLLPRLAHRRGRRRPADRASAAWPRAAPGPGWLVVFFGLAIWASEFEWAQRLLRLRPRAPAACGTTGSGRDPGGSRASSASARRPGRARCSICCTSSAGSPASCPTRPTAWLVRLPGLTARPH